MVDMVGYQLCDLLLFRLTLDGLHVVYLLLQGVANGKI